jgi:hypothetical protein
VANQWYIRRGSNVLGPSTSAQLKSDVAEGMVKRSDEISRSPEGPWTVARKVKGLFSAQQSEVSARPQSPPQDFTQSAPISEPSSRDFTNANPTPSVVTTSEDPITTNHTKKSIPLPQWAIIAIPAIVTLILGYFIGQEHLKYQMRSAIGDFTSAFAGFRKGNSPSESTRVPLTQLMIGQTYKTKQFAITLNQAKIETTKLKNFMGQIETGTTPDLVLSFTIANTDDRKILRLCLAKEFKVMDYFRLQDDVGNEIRKVNYGFSSTILGALTSTEIQPSASSTHVEIFSIPPPKTQFLILTVDLACFYGEGEIEFKIPASSIVK